jgi:hypothetical protein
MGSRPGRSWRQWSVPVQSFDFEALRELQNLQLMSAKFLHSFRILSTLYRAKRLR